MPEGTCILAIAGCARSSPRIHRVGWCDIEHRILCPELDNSDLMLVTQSMIGVASTYLPCTDFGQMTQHLASPCEPWPLGAAQTPCEHAWADSNGYIMTLRYSFCVIHSYNNDTQTLKHALGYGVNASSPLSSLC